VAKSRAPEVVTLSPTQLEELLAKLVGLLPAEIYQLVEKSLRTLHWVRGVIEAKETSLSRLQRLIFGAKTEKTKQLFPLPPARSQTAALAAAPALKRKGHGRTAAAGYTGAKRVRVTHPQLRPGDACHGCKGGKLYALKQLGQLVRITPNRCLPPPASNWRSCAATSAASSLLPQHPRKRGRANMIGRSAPCWAGQALEPVHEALITLAAQGKVIHNDDTPMQSSSQRFHCSKLLHCSSGLFGPVGALHTDGLHEYQLICVWLHGVIAVPRLGIR
jgi:hypothetical protein